MTAPTRAELIRDAIARLTAAGAPEPTRDARLLGRWAAGMEGARFSAALGDRAPPDEIARFEAAVDQRVQRAPVSQITGQREFWGRSFRVTPDVLDPRPETETLIEAALAGPAAARILDLGTGSGCILLTLLAEWPNVTGVGIDVSSAALAVAAGNVVALGVADRARLIRSDWFAAIEGVFDLIVSNPPYLAEAEMARLAPEVALHEPRLALTPGGDGLDAYRAIAAGAGRHLAPGGRIMLEIGPTQGDAVAAILADAGLQDHEIVCDLDGRARVVMVRAGRKIAGSR